MFLKFIMYHQSFNFDTGLSQCLLGRPKCVHAGLSEYAGLSEFGAFPGI